jgi:hypothetical protein
VTNDSAKLLRGAWQETWDIHKGDEGDVEASQNLTKRAAFTDASMSRQPANAQADLPPGLRAGRRAGQNR